MDAQLKQKWLEALRSGQYKQGLNGLRSKDNSFCCLGVLCDVMKPSAWDWAAGAWWSDGHTATLPLSVAMPAGLSAVDTDFQGTLMGMNDSGQSFAEIADWIEANIPAEVPQS